MDPDWAQQLTAFTAVVAVSIATFAWMTNVRTFRASYRPVLRPVPLSFKSTSLFHPGALKLKNIGRGPAITVTLVQGETTTALMMGGVDVIEPLGPMTRAGEAGRLGSVTVTVDPLFVDHGVYRAVYQDLAKRWHLTTFEVRGSDFAVKFLGPMTRWQRIRGLPAVAIGRAQVVNAREFV